MSIRSRMLAWLLPAMMVFVILISLFFYYNWYSAILKSVRGNLKSIVVSTAENLQPEEIKWIKQNANDPLIVNNPIYMRYLKILRNINTDLPIADLYILSIDPVPKGETVLLDQPKTPENPAYDGLDSNYAYREVYLLDPEVPSGIPLKTYGFTESNELSVYKTKAPFVTPIFQRSKSSNRFMTGYAPIIDQADNVVALVAADLNLEIFDKIHRNAIVALFLSAALTFFLLFFAVYWIANKISKPVQQLNSAALDMAAGDYEEDIQVTGPKEIKELSNTLNTLRECLLENNSRLRDASLARERLYGEYECALLLQNRMLDQVLENFKDPRFDIRHISYSASLSPQGILLDVLSSSPAKTMMSLRESNQEGFEGTYQLLREDKGDFIRFEFNHKDHTLVFNNHTMPVPFVWSTQTAKGASDGKLQFTLEPDDYFILANKGISKILVHPKLIQEWYSKVFRHFAKEGPDLLAAMLTSELNFLTKKQHATNDIHILCFHYKGE